jgi:hypothetical protein
MAGVTTKAKTPTAASPRVTARPKKQPRIIQIAERLGRRIPSGELLSRPKDLSNQLDHYIYGTPKR